MGIALVASLAAGGATCGPRPPPGGGPGSAADALARLERRGGIARNARGFASVTAWDARETFRGKVLLLAERPAKLHIEVLSPFDQPVAFLATDGTDLDVYLLDAGRFLTGRATADNLARLLPMRVAPAVLVEALLGGLPLPRPRDGSEADLSWNGDAGVYVLRWARPGPEAWLRPPELTPVQAGWLGPGDTQGWTLELTDHDEVMPRRLAFEHRGAGSGFRLAWDERQADVALPADSWRIQPPRGVPVESLGGVVDTP